VFLLYLARSLVFGSWFLVCYAATQLATQLTEMDTTNCMVAKPEQKRGQPWFWDKISVILYNGRRCFLSDVQGGGAVFSRRIILCRTTVHIFIGDQTQRGSSVRTWRIAAAVRHVWTLSPSPFSFLFWVGGFPLVGPLYGPSEVNTLQVDGLARIPELTQALYKSHPLPLFVSFFLGFRRPNLITGLIWWRALS